MRLDVDLGSDVSLGGSHPGVDVIISPDSARLVFVSGGRLFTRRLDEVKTTEHTELPGTEGASAPFFSPDGQWIGFFDQTKLKKISVEGGAAIPLCDVNGDSSGTWGEDGTIVATLGYTASLSQIPAAGGAPMPVTELDSDRKEQTHRWPQILPGGKAVLLPRILRHLLASMQRISKW